MKTLHVIALCIVGVVELALVAHFVPWLLIPAAIVTALGVFAVAFRIRAASGCPLTVFLRNLTPLLIAPSINH